MVTVVVVALIVRTMLCVVRLAAYHLILSSHPMAMQCALDMHVVLHRNRGHLPQAR